MTSSIPDGLSFADLQALMADAPKQESNIPQKTLSEKEISELVIPAVMSVNGSMAGSGH